MPIPVDFIVNLAAGLAQTLIQRLANRAVGDPQAHAIRHVFQIGFEEMLRTAGAGLSEAELGQVSDLFRRYLQQSNVADDLLEIALGHEAAQIDRLATSFCGVNPPDGLLNITFDPEFGLLALIAGIQGALLAEAKRSESPLANLVSISLLQANLRQTQHTVDVVRRDSRDTQPLATAGLANIELRRNVAEITICRSNPSVIYALIDNTLFVSRDSARTWSPTTAGIGLIAADPNHAAVVYALRTNGLFVSQDFGETWNLRSDAAHYLSIGSGRFTIHPADSERMLYSDMKGIYVSANQGRTWRNCFPAWRSCGDAPWYYATDRKVVGYVVATCYERGLFLTEDWGETWTEINSPPTDDKSHPGIMKPLAVDMRTSSIWYADLGTFRDTVHAASHPRGLFVTRNKGESWEQCSVGDPSAGSLVDYIEIVENAGQTIMYTAYPGGTTYRSQNGGRSWIPVTIDWRGLPSDFGQAERGALLLAPVDALTNDGLVYLKTQRGLLKSTDNGRSWYR
jgi:photosystem II stability/assembly factor-like uncharacterized protein